MRILIGLALLFCALDLGAQTQWFVQGNLNSYIPFQSEKEAVFLIGKLEQGKPKTKFGGYGVGVSMIKRSSDRANAKFSCGVNRYVYKNEAITFRDVNNSPMGNLITTSSDYVLSFQAVYHIQLRERLFAGTGVGANLMLISVIKNPTGNFAGSDGSSASFNRNFKPLMPLIPLEVTLRNPKAFYSIRYEQALINKYRGELAKSLKETFGVITLEFGIRFK